MARKVAAEGVRQKRWQRKRWLQQRSLGRQIQKKRGEGKERRVYLERTSGKEAFLGWLLEKKRKVV